MNLHHLELFYYVAKYRGINAAVRRIPYGIQQPAVSGQVRALEAALGVSLFDRRPFRLTNAGREVFAFIAPFFEGLPSLRERLLKGVVEEGGASGYESNGRNRHPSALAPKVAKELAVFRSLSRRYRHALGELAK